MSSLPKNPKPRIGSEKPIKQELTSLKDLKKVIEELKEIVSMNNEIISKDNTPRNENLYR